MLQETMDGSVAAAAAGTQPQTPAVVVHQGQDAPQPAGNGFPCSFPGPYLFLRTSYVCFDKTSGIDLLWPQGLPSGPALLVVLTLFDHMHT